MDKKLLFLSIICSSYIIKSSQDSFQLDLEAVRKSLQAQTQATLTRPDKNKHLAETILQACETLSQSIFKLSKQTKLPTQDFVTYQQAIKFQKLLEEFINSKTKEETNTHRFYQLEKQQEIAQLNREIAKTEKIIHNLQIDFLFSTESETRAMMQQHHLEQRMDLLLAKQHEFSDLIFKNNN